MKKVKILGVVLLLAVTITAFTLLNSVTTVTITSKGQGQVVKDKDNVITWTCVQSPNDCKITIEISPSKD
jgi:hypothetical protein